MCGRYSLVTSAKKIHDQLNIDIQVPEGQVANYNVAPTQLSWVITNEQPDKVQAYRWGLIPQWAKDDKIASRLINARCEGIDEKPAFRQAVRKRRCLVLADSFYEWKREGGKKMPYRIQLPDDRLMLLAGIWEFWKQDDDTIYTYSIITTSPNEEMKQLHDRMPVVLIDEEAQARWLSDAPLENNLALLRPAPDHTLELYQVSTLVNNVRNNGPELHERV